MNFLKIIGTNSINNNLFIVGEHHNVVEFPVDSRIIGNNITSNLPKFDTLSQAVKYYTYEVAKQGESNIQIESKPNLNDELIVISENTLGEFRIADKAIINELELDEALSHLTVKVSDKIHLFKKIKSYIVKPVEIIA